MGIVFVRLTGYGVKRIEKFNIVSSKHRKLFILGIWISKPLKRDLTAQQSREAKHIVSS